MNEFSIITHFLALNDFLTGYREKKGMLPLDMAFITLFFTILFSYVLFLNDSLERSSPHKIAKLDEHITFELF